MATITFIHFVALLGYSGVITCFLFIAVMFQRKKASPVSVPEENVSIVIPCRNEAANLPLLLTSLQQQQFNGLMEVIIVDDRSTDTTKKVIFEYQQHAMFPVKYIYNDFNPASGLTSKQQAIDTGINAASHDFVVLTDADMQYDQTWLQSFFQAIDHDTDLIYGQTAIKSITTPFSYVQSFQLAFLFSVAAVFHHAGICGSCMGNNIMIRKKTYRNFGGQKAVGYSITEDRALLCHFFRLRRKIMITFPFIPKAFTLPHTDVSLFIHQMFRWAKGGFTSGCTLFIFAALFSIENISLLLSIPEYLHTSCRIVAIINFTITWFFVAMMFKKNHAPVSPLLFPLFYIFIVVETLVLPPLLLVKHTIIWKGTKV